VEEIVCGPTSINIAVSFQSRTLKSEVNQTETRYIFGRNALQALEDFQKINPVVLNRINGPEYTPHSALKAALYVPMEQIR
jgi:hypothetical protein